MHCWSVRMSRILGFWVIFISLGYKCPPISIIGVPPNLALDYACPDSVRLEWDPVAGATGYEVSMLGPKYMDSLTYVTTTYAVVAIGNPALERWFSVKALSNDDCIGRRAIAIYHGGGTFNCTVDSDIEITAVNSPLSDEYVNCHDLSAVLVSIELQNNGRSPQCFNFCLHSRD